MRPIKFRAWDSSRKKLAFESFNLFGETLLVADVRMRYLPNIKVTQYTGLKDKNGKEIYEGDIIKLYNDDHFIDKIVYERVDAGMCFKLEKSSVLIEEECEVIGNIYETPELLDTN